MLGLRASRQNGRASANTKRLPSSSLDAMNHIVRSVSDQQLHCVLTYDKPLDVPLLNQAIRLTLDSEPVLGCRFIEHPQRPYWERRDDLDNTDFCQLVLTTDPSHNLWRFISTPADPQTDPLIQLRVFRDSHDVMCLKISHVVTDATGCKQYLYQLLDVYDHLRHDTHFRPTHRRSGDRGERYLFTRFSPLTLYRAFRKRQSPTPTWGFPRFSDDFSSRGYVMMRIPPSRFSEIKAYGGAWRATLNDILTTAYYRALFDYIDPPEGIELPISVPIDMRRYLPADNHLPVCNFSSSLFPSLSRTRGELFDATLVRVNRLMNALKRDTPGLHSAIYQYWSLSRGFETARKSIQFMQEMGVKYGTFYPMLTNFGILDDQQLHRGEDSPTDAYMVSPLFFPPGFMMGANTFKGTLTIIAGYCPSSTHTDGVRHIMESMDQELPGSGLLEPGIAVYS